MSRIDNGNSINKINSHPCGSSHLTLRKRVNTVYCKRISQMSNYSFKTNLVSSYIHSLNTKWTQRGLTAWTWLLSDSLLQKKGGWKVIDRAVMVFSLWRELRIGDILCQLVGDSGLLWWTMAPITGAPSTVLEGAESADWNIQRS